MVSIPTEAYVGDELVDCVIKNLFDEEGDEVNDIRLAITGVAIVVEGEFKDKWIVIDIDIDDYELVKYN